MFQGNFSAAPLLKKLARILFLLSFILCGVSLVAALILLIIDSDLLLISLLVIVMAGVSLLTILIYSLLLWGFSEIISNTSASASSVAPTASAAPQAATVAPTAPATNIAKPIGSSARAKKTGADSQFEALLKSGAITEEEYANLTK